MGKVVADKCLAQVKQYHLISLSLSLSLSLLLQCGKGAPEVVTRKLPALKALQGLWVSVSEYQLQFSRIHKTNYHHSGSPDHLLLWQHGYFYCKPIGMDSYNLVIRTIILEIRFHFKTSRDDDMHIGL